MTCPPTSHRPFGGGGGVGGVGGVGVGGVGPGVGVGPGDGPGPGGNGLIFLEQSRSSQPESHAQEQLGKSPLAIP